MSTRPDRILICFPADGAPAAVALYRLTTVNGREFPEDPIPLDGLDDPAFEQLATQFSAAAIGERDAALATVSGLTTERDELLAQVAALQQQVEELTPPAVDPDAVPATITRWQGRKWLLQEGLLENVEAMIAAAGLAAQIDYEAPTWYRASPLIAQLGAALGKSSSEVDDFFREAAALA